ncbi:hypothetical protein Hanom_Chr01g00022821 [Helianthus anomalus]
MHHRLNQPHRRRHVIRTFISGHRRRWFPENPSPKHQKPKRVTGHRRQKHTTVERHNRQHHHITQTSSESMHHRLNQPHRRRRGPTSCKIRVR